MGLTRQVLKRPVTTVMVILCLIVFGLQSVLTAKLELTPEMEMPMLLISTIYPGASRRMWMTWLPRRSKMRSGH